MTKTLRPRWWLSILAAALLLLGAKSRLEGQQQLVPRIAADTCAAAPYLIAGVTLPLIYVDTTVGQTNNYDLPTDLESPTCTASTNCTGGGAAASLPRGGIYSLTGTGPDRAVRIKTNLNCTLQIILTDLAGADLGLIIYQDKCSSLLSDCVCVDDSNVGGVAESVTLQAIAGIDYFIVVDGYGGASGGFQLLIVETTFTGCELVGATSLDIDGNGEVDALTDILLLLRYAFGFRGGTLVSGAVAADCTRCSPLQIEAYIGSI